MSKHTSGPWGFASDGSIRSNHTPANNYQSEYICSLLHYRDDRQDEKVANGHVLVAAPDLLAACEQALLDLELWHTHHTQNNVGGIEEHSQCLPGSECNNGCSTCQEAIPALKAAIAKAKGEA